MQTLEKKFPNGSVHTYTLTEPIDNGTVPYRKATKDGNPYLHITKSPDGYCNILILLDDGYVKKCELIVKFEELNVEMIAL